MELKKLSKIDKPKIVGERMKKALTDEVEVRLKDNTLCKGRKK